MDTKIEFIGFQTTEICPLCKKHLLFKNKTGNKWCSGDECSYHVDKNGKQRSIPAGLKAKYDALTDKAKSFKEKFHPKHNNYHK